MSTNFPPNNLELERAVLGAVLRSSGQNIDSQLSILKSGMFSTFAKMLYVTCLAHWAGWKVE